MREIPITLRPESKEFNARMSFEFPEGTIYSIIGENPIQTLCEYLEKCGVDPTKVTMVMRYEDAK